MDYSQLLHKISFLKSEILLPQRQRPTEQTQHPHLVHLPTNEEVFLFSLQTSQTLKEYLEYTLDSFIRSHNSHYSLEAL